MTSVGGVAVDSTGRIFVFDRAGKDIRVYGPDGAYLYSFGREGEGPGEFHGRSNQLMGVTGPRVWVLEPAAIRRRWTLFTLEGRLISTRRFEPVALPVGDRVPAYVSTSPSPSRLVLAHVPLEPLGEGFISSVQYVDLVEPGPPDYGPGDTLNIPRLVIGTNGEILDTVGWERHVLPEPVTLQDIVIDGMTGYVPLPPRADPLSVQTRNGRWVIHRRVADSSEAVTFRVVRLNLEGDTLVLRDFRYRPLQWTEDELRTFAIVKSGLGWVEHGDGAAVIVGPPITGIDADRLADVMLREMKFPKYHLPWERAIANQDGSLWLQWWSRAGDPQTYLIVDADGDPAGRVQMPKDVLLEWASSDSFIGVHRDSLRVPWLIRYRLQR